MPVLPKNKAFAALLATSLLALPASLAWAEDNGPREAVIVVSGQADAKVAPDLAIVTLSVAETAKTAREALDANNKAMTAVLAALKEEKIADRDLQTSGFSIEPQYFYPDSANGENRPPVLTGYRVVNGLTVRVRALSKLGAILDRSVSLGINQGGEIRFANDNPDQAIATARAAAMKDAVAKARVLADAAGVKLGRVVEISEDASRPEPQPVLRMAMAAKESDGAVPMATGENSYSVTVSATFAINQ